jgi:hypothetical protein
MSGPISGIRRPSRLLGLALGAALVASLIPLAGVAAIPATVSVSAVTGGSAISADTNAATGSNTATGLGGPVLTESALGAIASDGTISLTLPSGFQFATSSTTAAPGVTAGCGLTASAISYSGTPNVATVTITNAPSTTACTIQFSGLAVVPSSSTPGSGAIAVGGTTGAAYSPSSAGTIAEVPGAPHLSFTPGYSTSSLGGATMATSPTIHDQDQFTNPRSGDSIALAVSSGPSGGTVLCTSNSVTTNGSGDAAFQNCVLNKVGNYVLYASTATALGSTSAVSGSISVTAGPAAKLAFVTYPAATTTTALGTISVQAQDLGGNPVFSNSAVTLSINKNASTFMCSTSLTQTLNGSGAASWSSCQETVAATGYTLTATVTSGTSLAPTTTSFDVTSGAASKLAFYWNTAGITTVPVGSTGGTAFPVQPVIVLQDVNGNTVTSNSSVTVTLALTSNTTGATLACTSGLSRVVSAGVATFSGCSINKVGTYQLTATSSPYYTAATSGSFVVSAGPPVKLTLTSQPTSGVAAQAFATQPVVAITDAGGNVATTSSATITLSLTSYTAGGVLTCTSGLSRTTVSGVATFSGCSINAAGTNYVITATATNVYPVTTLAAVSGNAFTVTAPAAQITLSTSATVITWSQSVTLTGQFGLNGASKSVVLQTSTDQVNWTNTANLTANSAGTATFTWTPARNLYYRLVFAGAPDLSAANSNTVRVVVRQIALLRPILSGKVKTISSGTSITFTTTVRPARVELPKAKVTFTFVLKRGSKVVYSGKRDVYIDANGKASWTWKFGSAGDWYVRSIANPTTANANSVWSPLQHYVVP